MRTKRILALTLAILIALCSVPFTVSATSLYAEKSISAEEPMGTAIATAEELLKLMNTPTMWQGVYYLAADITLPAESAANLKPSEPDGEGEEATGPEQLYQRPIGTTTRFFTGVFDGNGKTISGLALEGSKYQALFGVAQNATIKNLTVNGTVTDTTDAASRTEVNSAGIVGALSGNSTLENIVSYVDVTATASRRLGAVGGLVGKMGCFNNGAVMKVIDCHVYGTVTGAADVGGLIGIVSASGLASVTSATKNGRIYVADCTSEGNVVYNSGEIFAVCGGLVGGVYTYKAQGFEINFLNCENRADITYIQTVKGKVGGLIGVIGNSATAYANDSASASAANEAGGTVNIVNCRNEGDLTSSTYCAGIVGQVCFLLREDYTVNITGCRNTGTVQYAGTTTAGGFAGILGSAMGGEINISACENSGTINGYSSSAGIAGYLSIIANTAELSLTIADCGNYGAITSYGSYATGIVSRSVRATGLTFKGAIKVIRCINGGEIDSTTKPETATAIVNNLVGLGMTWTDNVYFNTETSTAGKGTAIAPEEAGNTSNACYTNWDFDGVWTVSEGLPYPERILRPQDEALPEQVGTAIATADDLLMLMNDPTLWSGSYYLAADIYLPASSAAVYTEPEAPAEEGLDSVEAVKEGETEEPAPLLQQPIGNEEKKYTGCFDGNGKTIYGLSLEGKQYQGLFGFASNATICDLTVKGTVTDLTDDETAQVWAGGVVGALYGNSLIDNVISYVDVYTEGANTQAVGGLIGMAGFEKYYCTVTVRDCHAYGTVEAGRGAGNLIGVVSLCGIADTETPITGGRVSVTGCTSNGKVISHSGTVYGQCGGLIGNVFGYMGRGFCVNISDCENHADLSGCAEKARVGGIIGWINCDMNTSKNPAGGVFNITGCRNTSDISAVSYNAGIVGVSYLYKRSDYILNITDCLNTGAISASSTASGAGGIVAHLLGGVCNISGCANAAPVTGTTMIGGIVGYVQKNANCAVADANITDCVNYGNLRAETRVAGIAANANGDVTIDRCFNGGTVYCSGSEQPYGAVSGNLVGTDTVVRSSYYLPIGKETRASVLSYSAASVSSSFEGWDFDTVWMTENGLPTLRAFPGISRLVGDANGNGTIDNTDISLIVRRLAGWTDVSFSESLSDATGDGKLNNRDAVLVINLVAGWTDVQ